MEAIVMLAIFSALLILFRAIIRYESGSANDLGVFSFIDDSILNENGRQKNDNERDIRA